MRDPRAAVNVPVNYVFRPIPTKWTLAQARVVAWSQLHQQEALQHEEAKRRAAGKIVFPAIRVPPLGVVDPAYLTRLRLEVTQHGKAQASFVDVERDFIPSGLLPVAATPENSPRIESAPFIVLVDCELPLPQKQIGSQLLGNSPNPSPVYLERKPWQMRKEFLALQENDNHALLDFLRRWGAWGYDPFQHMEAVWHHLYQPQGFWRFRDLLRSHGVLSAEKWLKIASPLPPWSTEALPFYTLTRAHIRAALEDTITLEKMKKTEHAICARKGCGNIIAKTGKRTKKFCSESCGLKVRQQRYWSTNGRRNAQKATA